MGEGEESYRDALAAVIATAGDMERVNCVSSSNQALSTVQLANPDVVLMVLETLGDAAVATLRALTTACPKAAVLVLSGKHDEQHVLQALSSGALGFLLKSSPWSAICEAVREVHRGGTPLSAEVKPTLVKLVRSVGGEHRVEHLTAREQQILDLLVKKSRNKEIALVLKLSVPTVRTHLRSIYLKLNIGSRSEAIEKLGQAAVIAETQSAPGAGPRLGLTVREKAMQATRGALAQAQPSHGPPDAISRRPFASAPRRTWRGCGAHSALER